MSKVNQKIYNLLMLSRCLLGFLMRGNSKNTPRKIENVLVCQMAKLGDTVCITPIFSAVKERYPHAKLYVLGKSRLNKELLAYHPHVHEYIVYSGDFNKTLKYLRGKKFDFACTVTPDFTSLALCFLSGIRSLAAPEVVNGISPYETRSYGVLKKFVHVKPHSIGSYAPREYLRLLEPINIYSHNTEKKLYFSNEAREFVHNFFLENRIDPSLDFLVGISPSAGNSIKKWAQEKFAAVASYVAQKYHGKIFIIGSFADKENIDILVHLLDKETPVINCSGKFTIDQLKAFISFLHLFISVDTGPVYIAESFNVPTIDIIGPMDENEQPPIGDRHKIVKIPNRSHAELHIMNARIYNKIEAQRQIDEISPEMVIKAVDELIPIIKKI